jgi:murein DD-endopeptidase MepM/ murein hydrolase activator NlpD
VHPIYNELKQHNGLDIDGAMGEPMRASESGLVLVAEERGGYGLTVVIDHGNQLATLYGHMSRLDVRPGDLVSRGQQIGLVGSTGLSTGPHCHWEVRVLGLPVDGRPYLSILPE